MNRKLYHRDLGFPQLVIDQINKIGARPLFYSRHALQACLDDRYGTIRNPPGLLLVAGPRAIVEAEVINGVLVKVVIRAEYDSYRDICLAVGLDVPKKGIVRTVWTNLKSDNHRTLDASKYDKP